MGSGGGTSPREELECGVLDGKIYVFGRERLDWVWSGSGPEVYDPKENTWSATKQPPSLRSDVQVEAMGDELVVHNECCLVATPNVRNRKFRCEITDFWELYHPMKDEWRVVESFGQHEHLVMAKGKLYSFSPYGIKVYDAQAKTWEDLHSFSLAAFSPVDRLTTYVENVVALSMAGILKFGKTSGRP